MSDVKRKKDAGSTPAKGLSPTPPTIMKTPQSVTPTDDAKKTPVAGSKSSVKKQLLQTPQQQPLFDGSATKSTKKRSSARKSKDVHHAASTPPIVQKTPSPNMKINVGKTPKTPMNSSGKKINKKKGTPVNHHQDAKEKENSQRKSQKQGTEEKEEKEQEMIKDVAFRPAMARESAKYTNRQKCLVLGTRNITTKERHLLTDIKGFLPHTREHQKLTSKDDMGKHLRELCELHRCNSCCFLEARKHENGFLWLTQMPNGPSVKFQTFNVHTADELRMAGNCLKFSRALLHFDKEFDVVPQLRIIKGLLTMVFNTPKYHPRSKPFVDHILCFFFLDGKIWFRHYQICVPSAAPKKKSASKFAVPSGGPEIPASERALEASVEHSTKALFEKQLKLMEIGPRFVLEPLVILNGTMKGNVLWKNQVARTLKEVKIGRKLRMRQKMERNLQVGEKSRKVKDVKLPDDPLANVFS